MLLEQTAVSLSPTTSLLNLVLFNLFIFSLFFLRSIPSAKNVPRGSRFLDDYVLQHYPLPLHFLAHLQPFLAYGWQHEVSTSLTPFYWSLRFTLSSMALPSAAWCKWLKHLSKTLGVHFFELLNLR